MCSQKALPLHAPQECPRLRTLTLRHTGGAIEPNLSTLVLALCRNCPLLTRACFDSCEAGRGALEVHPVPDGLSMLLQALPFLLVVLVECPSSSSGSTVQCAAEATCPAQRRSFSLLLRSLVR